MPDEAAREARRHDREHRGVFAAIRVVSGLTLVSRFGGLARDAATSRAFGDTAVASAFALAFMIPNLFRRLFGEGALSAAFIPEYARLQRDDPRLADRFASLTVAALSLLTIVITLAGEALLFLALWSLPPSESRDLVLRLAIILAPYMPLVCVTALLGGVLQSHGRFGPTAASPVVLNALTVIACVIAFWTLGLDNIQTAYAVSATVLLAGMIQVTWSLLALRPHVRWTRAFEGAGPAARSMIRRFLPGVVGLGTLQLNAFFDGLIASWPILVGPAILGVAYPLDEASNGILGYAQRLYQFPLGVFGIAVATAVFPSLSRAVHDRALFTDMLRRGVRLSLFIAIPASAGLFLVRHDASYVLFRGENFSAEGVRRAALILAGYAPAIWAYSANHVLIRAFYAIGDTRTPMRTAIVSVCVNLAGNLALIWVMGEAGLALSTAISSTIQLALLTRAARRLDGGAPLFDGPLWRSVGVTVSLTLAMSLIVLAAQRLAPQQESWTSALLRLLAAGLAGAGAYGAMSALARAPELRWLLSRSPSRDGVSPRA